MVFNFDNGNFVDVIPNKKSGSSSFNINLNGKDVRERVSADLVVILLNDLRKITCTISSWSALY